MKTLVNVVGNYVVGERFWGREKELEHLLELIEEGANISIMAQRRIGKTSLMHEAGRNLPANFIGLHIDLQAEKSAADVISKLAVATRPYDSLWTRSKDVFHNVLAAVTDNVESLSVEELQIQFRSGLSGSNWQDKGSQILSNLASHEKRVVLFIDELPILIARMLDTPDGGGKNAVHTLLAWMREKALAHQGRLNMVFAGSIGLEPVLNRTGLTSDINHLTPFPLEPWGNPVALGCIQALAAHRSIDIPEQTALHMLELLGCNIPHHVQLFFSKVREHCINTGMSSCSIEDINSIFRHKMLSTQGHAELHHMEERLQKTFPANECRLAVDLLTQIAVTGTIARQQMQTICANHGVTVREQMGLLSRLFRILEHDGYLTKTPTDEYVFQSNLLREWWRARFGAFFDVI